MEIATLFVIGTMKGVRTAAIAVADGNIFAENEYDPHGTVVANGKVNMIKTGLKVAKKAAIEDAQMDHHSIFD